MATRCLAPFSSPRDHARSFNYFPAQPRSKLPFPAIFCPSPILLQNLIPSFESFYTPSPRYSCIPQAPALEDSTLWSGPGAYLAVGDAVAFHPLAHKLTQEQHPLGCHNLHRQSRE